MTETTETTETPERTFGAAVERLEAIVARLEGDETLGLEEALELYRQGVALAGDCRRRLAGAQLTLTELPVRPSQPEGIAGGDPEDPDGHDDPDAGDPEPPGV
jgi:exodeoxyribonuclease VII small subunit